ncbi:hypothetical protein BX600DRAFT_542307 [Xylariales sp. PMI_506]|nr:hypothetical protein BX600DRAFT_542307 [Xylariales sp. PMI_506]
MDRQTKILTKRSLPIMQDRRPSMGGAGDYISDEIVAQHRAAAEAALDGRIPAVVANKSLPIPGGSSSSSSSNNNNGSRAGATTRRPPVVRKRASTGGIRESIISLSGTIGNSSIGGASQGSNSSGSGGNNHNKRDPSRRDSLQSFVSQHIAMSPATAGAGQGIGGWSGPSGGDGSGFDPQAVAHADHQASGFSAAAAARASVFVEDGHNNLGGGTFFAPRRQRKRRGTGGSRFRYSMIDPSLGLEDFSSQDSGIGGLGGGGGGGGGGGSGGGRRRAKGRSVAGIGGGGEGDDFGGFGGFGGSFDLETDLAASEQANYIRALIESGNFDLHHLQIARESVCDPGFRTALLSALENFPPEIALQILDGAGSTSASSTNGSAAAQSPISPSSSSYAASSLLSPKSSKSGRRQRQHSVTTAATTPTVSEHRPESPAPLSPLRKARESLHTAGSRMAWPEGRWSRDSWSRDSGAVRLSDKPRRRSVFSRVFRWSRVSFRQGAVAL